MKRRLRPQHYNMTHRLISFSFRQERTINILIVSIHTAKNKINGLQENTKETQIKMEARSLHNDRLFLLCILMILTECDQLLFSQAWPRRSKAFVILGGQLETMNRGPPRNSSFWHVDGAQFFTNLWFNYLLNLTFIISISLNSQCPSLDIKWLTFN